MAQNWKFRCTGCKKVAEAYFIFICWSHEDFNDWKFAIYVTNFFSFQIKTFNVWLKNWNLRAKLFFYILSSWKTLGLEKCIFCAHLLLLELMKTFMNGQLQFMCPTFYNLFIKNFMIKNVQCFQVIYYTFYKVKEPANSIY